MIWYLLFCTNSLTCLPAQPMPSKAACVFIGRNYVEVADRQSAKFRCVGVKGPGHEQ